MINQEQQVEVEEVQQLDHKKHKNKKLIFKNHVRMFLAIGFFVLGFYLSIAASLLINYQYHLNQIDLVLKTNHNLATIILYIFSAVVMVLLATSFFTLFLITLSRIVASIIIALLKKKIKEKKAVLLENLKTTIRKQVVQKVLKKILKI